jgi:Mrp family chromosome partitioning ATPase/capsular polysaccharide biosynthesis protein
VTPEAPARPNLRDYLVPVWRHKWAVLALVLVVTAGTYWHYNREPRRYSAQTDIYLNTSQASAIVTGTSQPGTDRELADQARVLKSRSVAERVARQMQFRGDRQVLLDSVAVVQQAGSDFITINTSWPTPEGAARLANAFATAFRDQRLASVRDNARSALVAAQQAFQQAPKRSTQRQSLADRISQLEILQSLPSGDAQQVDQARAAAHPYSPQPKRNAMFAFALSLALAIIAAYGFDRIDRRIHGLDEVKPHYDAPVLAAIPRADMRRVLKPPASVPSNLVEAFRTLRTALDTAGNFTQGTQVVLVTSAIAREGKSTIVRNLALACHEAGKRVAVVDADLRHPTLARSLFTPVSPGLSEVLKDTASLHDALHEVVTQIEPFELVQPAASRSGKRHARASQRGQVTDMARGADLTTGTGLMLLPSGMGASDPPALLGTDKFKAVLRELKANFDLVLIDSTPLLSVSDAIPVLTEVDGVLLVSRVGRTTEDSAKHVADLMTRIGRGHLLGVVANNVGLGSQEAGYRIDGYATAG